MMQPGADQHESRVTIWKTIYYLGTSADFLVYPINNIIGTDAGPVFAGKIAIGQSILKAPRRLYRSMMAASKGIPLNLGTLRVTSPGLVVRLRL